MSLLDQLQSLPSTLEQYRHLRTVYGNVPGSLNGVCDLLDPRFPEDTLADRLRSGAVSEGQVVRCFGRAA